MGAEILRFFLLTCWPGKAGVPSRCSAERAQAGAYISGRSAGLEARPVLPLSPGELLSCLLPAWSLTSGNALMLEECQVWDVVVPKP